MDTAIVLQTGGDFLVPAAPLQTMLATYQAKKDFISHVLAEGVDFGKIPGAGDKPALFKAGAEKMTSFFGLAPVFEDVQTVEDWTGENHGGEPFFYFRQRCKLYRGERMIGSAEGSCNSWEKKYRYRSSSRVCPNCGKATIITGKAEYGGGYICFAKKGGCGAKFKTGDQAIEGQTIGEIRNPDVADAVNTILKMAQKRALVAAVLIATNISDYFTQDIEDYVNGEIISVTPVSTNPPAPAPKRTEAEILDELGYAPDPVTGAKEPKAAPQPDPPAAHVTPERPYAPDVLKKGLIASAKKQANHGAEPEMQSVAAALEELLGSEEKRRELVKWLADVQTGSMKEVTPQYIRALHAWLKPSYDPNSKHYTVDQLAAVEATAAHTYALKAAGQETLL